MSVFAKCSRQAQTFGVYVKQENERVWINVSVRGNMGGWGGSGCGAWQKPPMETQGLDQGPSGEAGPFTSAQIKKKAVSAAVVLAALFVGDNGLKSKTDSLLRGNTEPASELIKPLLWISEGAAYLMSDARRGHLAPLQPCKRTEMKNKRKQKLLHS